MLLSTVISLYICTYNNINVAHNARVGQSLDPVRYQRPVSHRQKRLRNADQVGELPAAVVRNIPLEPGSVPGSENYGFHFI